MGRIEQMNGVRQREMNRWMDERRMGGWKNERPVVKCFLYFYPQRPGK